MKCIITREQSATVKYAHRHPPPHSLSVQKSKYESTATQYATQLHTKATPDRALLTSAACAFATLTVMWGSAVMGRKPLLSLCLLGAAACVVCRAPSPTLGHRPRQPCLFGKSGSIPRRSGPAVWTPAQSNDHNCGGGRPTTLLSKNSPSPSGHGHLPFRWAAGVVGPAAAGAGGARHPRPRLPRRRLGDPDADHSGGLPNHQPCPRPLPGRLGCHFGGNRPACVRAHLGLLYYLCTIMKKIVHHVVFKKNARR